MKIQLKLAWSKVHVTGSGPVIICRTCKTRKVRDSRKDPLLTDFV